MTACCSTIIDFCFAHLHLNRIELKCGTHNIKSKRVAEKLGFTLEGVLRQAEFLNGSFIDLNIYSLLKGDNLEENV